MPLPPGGTLAEYIPFYFTPLTPMLYNIRTGHGGIRRRPNQEIVILVSSLPRLEESGIRYVFTDRHASLAGAKFFDNRTDLERIDYELLQERDFQRDPEDPGKLERYQAEALVYRHLPVTGLLGLACYSEETWWEIQAAMNEHGVELKTVVRPGWFFR